MGATATDETLSLKDVRRHCLDCSAGSAKYVTWCPCDGVNSTRCRFWPFRFGQRPTTFRAKYGDRLLSPEQIPGPNVTLDDLPATWEDAATAEIDVDGYRAPAVQVDRPQRSPVERAALAARFRPAPKKPR